MQQPLSAPPRGKTTLSIPDAVARATSSLAKGNTADAEKVAGAVLAAQPGHAEALQVMAIVRQRQGKLADAALLMRKAVTAAPRNGQMLSNLCEILRQNGELAAAAEAGRRAVATAPRMASAYSNLGVVLYDQEDYDAALEIQTKAIALNPRLLSALNNIGSILRKRGDHEGAEAKYREVLDISPSHIETVRNLGSLMVETERPGEALKVLLPQLRKTPQDAEIHRALGRAFLQLEELDRAEMAFRKALDLNPQLSEARLGLAEVYQKKNHPALALEQAIKAAEAKPGVAYAHQQIGHCQADLGNVPAAFEQFELALSIDPDFCPALLSRGYLHMENGDMDLARRDFEQVEVLKPGTVESLFSSVRLDKIKAGDPRIAQLEGLAAQAVGFVKNKAIAVHYSLAKCYEDTRDYDNAFQQYAAGAKLKRSTLTYDADAHDRKLDAMIDTFDADLIDRLRAAANPSVQPIFVLGMPRSGTTLTESIIASHPMVFGAGELHHLQRQFAFDNAAEARALGKLLRNTPSEAAERIAGYLQKLDAHAPGSARITDKMPANFHYLGLIHALLPNAKIFHVTRDPVDTCVSCYTRLFERSQYHSYDQVELGRYYNSYRRIMAHWTNILPQGAFHTVNYEALVAEPEAEARAMLAYCGLEWDDACLEFHNAKRRVRTASVQQVRNPVYSSSVAKWKQYEAHLGPLLAVLKAGGNLPETAAG